MQIYEQREPFEHRWAGALFRFSFSLWNSELNLHKLSGCPMVDWDYCVTEFKRESKEPVFSQGISSFCLSAMPKLLSSFVNGGFSSLVSTPSSKVVAFHNFSQSVFVALFYTFNILRKAWLLPKLMWSYKNYKISL